MAACTTVSGPAVISGTYHGVQGADDMKVKYRFHWPDFYKDNSNYTPWANSYAPAPRVIDSARLFARGHLGSNSSFANIYVVNLTNLRAGANSLAPSGLCPFYADNSGGTNKTAWDNTYLPPIVQRINKLLKGNLNFTVLDVFIFLTRAVSRRRSPDPGVQALCVHGRGDPPI